MDKVEHISGGVVLVTLDVGLGLGYVGSSRNVVPRVATGRRLVLPAGCRDETVGRVVAELTIKGVAAAEEGPQLTVGGAQGGRIVGNATTRRAIVDGEDIADQIVDIAEVLQDLAGRSVGRPISQGVVLAKQANQAVRVWVVGVAGHDTVAVGDQHPLALGVVRDALHVHGVVQKDPGKSAAPVIGRLQHHRARCCLRLRLVRENLRQRFRFTQRFECKWDGTRYD